MRLLLLLLLFPAYLFAQNLVPNWSFETHSACPINFNQIEYASGWKKSNQNNNGTHHTDYLNACGGNTGTSYFTVPTNVWGHQNAASGDGYAALSTTALNLYEDYRENIFCQLLQPMIIGATYSVSLKVCKSEKTKNAGNRIGVKFSTDSSFAVNNIAHVFADSVIEDTATWTVITGTFIADSAYTYIGVGNFFTDDSTILVNVCPVCPQIPSLYFIDDVCVHKGAQADCSYSVSAVPIEASQNSLRCYQIGANELQVNFETNRSGLYTFIMWNPIGQRSSAETRFIQAGETTFALPIEITANAIVFLQATGPSHSLTKAVVVKQP